MNWWSPYILHDLWLTKSLFLSGAGHLTAIVYRILHGGLEFIHSQVCVVHYNNIAILNVVASNDKMNEKLAEVSSELNELICNHILWF